MSTAARIDELRKKFEENPRRYFAPLANELRKAGNLSEAIALCREFLPKQPEHMSGYIVFGQALYESGDLSDARVVFEQALALDPENLKALRHLGDIAKWEGDTAGARRWYERVLEADPRNDDIAAQLATLATPVHVVPVVPEPEPAAPTPSAVFAPPTSVPPTAPVFTPPFSMAPIGMGAIPTPDAALRAVDFDEINARLREPDAPPMEHIEPPAFREAELLDLDAIEAAGGDIAPEASGEEAVEVEAVVQAVEAATDVVVAAETDDPFGFTETATEEVPFEEGLIAPEWPDTSDLVARIATPRTVTPLFVSSMTPDAVAAFGVESGDPLPAPALGEKALFADIEAQFGQADEPSVHAAAERDVADLGAVIGSEAEFEAESELAEVSAAVVSETVAEAEAEVAMDAPVEATVETMVEVEASTEAPAEAMVAVESVLESEAEVSAEADSEPVRDVEAIQAIDDYDELDEAEPEWIVATAPVPAPSVEDELPWLAPAPDREAAGDEGVVVFVDEATSIDEGLASAAAVPAEMPEVAALFGDNATDSTESEYESDPVEASFADVMPEEHNPAFVTETMGELLVSQGFTARAVSVYEELVRRRPYDPVLTSRLAELQERLAAEAAPVTPAFPTPAFPTPAFPTPAFGAHALGTPARGTPAFVASMTQPMATPLSVTPVSATPISSPAYEAAEFEEEPVERVTARERFARLASRRVPRRTPPRASVAVDTPADGLASLFGGEAPMHDDLAARALADAFAPIDEISHFGGELPFEEAMLGGAARMATPMRSATPIATAAVSDAGGPFSFDRFFPDPATSSSPQHTPSHSPSHTPATESAREVPPPTVSDDLAQFSAWLKGLGNT